MERPTSRSRRRLERAAASVGFAALAAAVLVAHANPPAGYELSVYHGTPLGFWVGLGLALTVSVFAAMLARDGTVRRLALALGGCSVVAFAGLPLIRGYFLYGSGDSLTHLGWIREMATGHLGPLGLIYPGIHVLTVFASSLSGFGLERTTMVVVVAFVVVYLLFVPLTMRALTDSQLGRTIGVLSALLLLPINVFVTKLAVHSISQATFFFALVLFLFTRYVTTDEAADGPTNVGVLLALSTVAVLLFHPQQAAVVLLLFGTVSAVQLVDRRRSEAGRTGAYRPMYAQTLFLAVVFVLWAAFHSDLAGQMSGILSTIVEFVLGTSDEAASEVAQRSSSLSAIGSGIDEIFLKLFLVSAVYSLLAGIVMLASVLPWFENADGDTGALQRYVSFGFMVLSPFAFLHFVGGMSKFYFRYHASMMLIVTVLGALGLARLAGYRRSPSGDSSGRLGRLARLFPAGPGEGSARRVGDARRAAVAVALVAMLALSLATVFPSPFIYQTSVHVTEMQFAGYESAFAHQDSTVAMSGISMPHWRYRHAILGTTGRSWGPTYTPRGTFDHNVTGYLRNHSRADGAHYLVVTTYDRRAEAEVYDGLRFTAADFRAIRAAPHVNLVQSNGEVRLYYAVDDGSPEDVAASRGTAPPGPTGDARRAVDPPRWPRGAGSYA